MAKQFRGNQRGWKRSTIHTNEGATKSLGSFVNGTGDEFFACAGFPVIRTVESVGPTLAIRERTAFRDLDVPTNLLEHRSLVDLLAMFSAEFEVLFVDFQGLDPAL